MYEVSTSLAQSDSGDCVVAPTPADFIPDLRDIKRSKRFFALGQQLVVSCTDWAAVCDMSHRTVVCWTPIDGIIESLTHLLKSWIGIS